MTTTTHDLLERLITEEAVGTLHLGGGHRDRSLFFTGHEVHLLESGAECRFLPHPIFFNNRRIARAAFDAILEEAGRAPQSLRSLLAARKLITPAQEQELGNAERLEEMLLLLERSERRVFEEGEVPEELLAPGENSAGIPNATLLEALLDRANESAEIRRVLPDESEVPILVDKGAALVANDGQWLFRQIAQRVDGRRTIRELADDAICFPHLARQVLAASIRQGWMKKTRFTEYEACDPYQYTPYRAREVVALLEEAIETAVDDVPLRQKLALFYLRSGQVDGAVREFARLAEIYQGRGSSAAALAAYREALRWEPAATAVRDLLVTALLALADHAAAEGDPEEERRYLVEAIAANPLDLAHHLRFADSFGGDEAQVLSALPQLFTVLAEAQRPDLGPALVARLRERFPDSLTMRACHIQTLVECGLESDAVREMEQLAGTYLDRRCKRDAERIYRRIGELFPHRRERQERMARLLRREPRKRRRVWRPSRKLAITLAILSAIATYQLYAYSLFRELGRKGEAYAESTCPAVGDGDYPLYRTQGDEILRELKSYVRVHFLSACGFVARAAAHDLEQRLDFMATQVEDTCRKLWDRAEEETLRGRGESALDVYSELVAKGVGTSWETLAATRVEEIRSYESAASLLLARAETLCEQEEFRESFLVYRGLLRDHPSSSAARAVALPILVTSAPAGAQVYEGQVLLGSAPLLVRVHPARPVTLRLTAPGYAETSVTLDDPPSPDLKVRLRRGL